MFLSKSVKDRHMEILTKKLLPVIHMSSNFINTLYINSYVSLIGTRQICVPSFKVLSEYVRFE